MVEDLLVNGQPTIGKADQTAHTRVLILYNFFIGTMAESYKQVL